MSQATEPRNPFYFLLLLASFAFVLTALGYAVVPVLEKKAIEAGEQSAVSGLSKILEKDGGTWLLYEVGAMILFGLLSMGLDRYRRLQKERASAPVPSTGESPDPGPPTA